MKTILPIVLTIALLACEEGPIFKSNDPQFNIELFEQNINSAFANHTIGYAYTIGQKGQLVRSGTSGLRRTSADGTEAPMTIYTRVNTASVSKFITALGAMKLIENNNNNISYFTQIGAFLPTSWKATDDFKNITFRELLRHRSGIKRNNNDGFSAQRYEVLKDEAEKFNNPNKSYEYCNKNFAMFRVLIPHLFNFVPWTGSLPDDQIYAELYKSYIRDSILQPAEIENPTLDFASDYAYLYPFPYQNQNGTGNQDWTLHSGAGGWYLSAYELGSLLAYTWYTEDVVRTETLDLITHQTGLLGLSETITNGDHGIYLAKGGSLINSNPHIFVIHYPKNDIQLAITTTGTDYNTNQFMAVLRDAYDDAWE